MKSSRGNQALKNGEFSCFSAVFKKSLKLKISLGTGIATYCSNAYFLYNISDQKLGRK